MVTSKGKPSWLKIRPPEPEQFTRMKSILRKNNLVTVCEESHCPNMGECWSRHATATFMIMGDTCTRACKFCSVKTGFPGKSLDPFEPVKLARTVAEMELDYVVITSVDRDDLPDQGSEHFARCIRAVKHPKVIVEVLIPDFRGDVSCLGRIVKAKPDVIGHNVETVEELQRKVRDPRANYQQSLFVLANVKKMDSTIFTKSSLMLGLGETEEAVLRTMEDLRYVGADILTLGQYLQPSDRHLPVKKYVHPDKFRFFRREAEKMGFLYVVAGPFVRSSYRVGEFFVRNILNGQSRQNMNIHISPNPNKMYASKNGSNLPSRTSPNSG